MYTAYTLRLSFFQTLVTVKWGNFLPIGAVTKIKCVVACAHDPRPKTRLIFDRMITEGAHCDMLSKNGVSNIQAGDNEQLYAPHYPGRCPSDMSVPVKQKV
jgi:hypothetical protein